MTVTLKPYAWHTHLVAKKTKQNTVHCVCISARATAPFIAGANMAQRIPSTLHMRGLIGHRTCRALRRARPIATASQDGLDAVVVLAGGQTAGGSNPEWVTRRLDKCADIHRETGAYIVCSGGGTPHKPPHLNEHGFVIHESVSCAQYLMDHHGIHPRHLLREVSSYDTIGNAYFALTIHALPRKWRRLCVVTSDFHMPRSRAIWVALARLAERDGHGCMALDFVAVSDEGVFETGVLEARRRREAESLARWEADVAGMAGLGDFSEWLHQTHLCYAVGRQKEMGMPTDVNDLALKSY